VTARPRRNAFRLVRVYDEEQAAGYRVLVDRLWPRGITKARAGLDEWLKDIAPSDELRRWYGHEPSKFQEFRRRYRGELQRQPASDAVKHLHDLAAEHGSVTLLTATRDVDHSGARVVLDHLERVD
jgi:uncharacterized protein YeaO (DUF488 family)